MIDFTRALVSELRRDTTLADLLGTFRGHAAVFAFTPVPETAGDPFIVTSAASDITGRSKQEMTREVTQDVRIYTEDDGNVSAIEQIAEHVRDRFARASFEVSDWRIVHIHSTGPTPINTDEQYGRVVTLDVMLART